MRSFLTSCILLLTVGLAVWSYSEMNTTKVTLDRVEQLNRDIAVAKSRLRKLNAEWAYQNRPQRLEALAFKYSDELQLFPLTKDNFLPLSSLPKSNLNERILSAITTPVEVMDRGVTQ
ncbi:MAG: cell division protein FtsL [Planktomarina sp.]